MGNDVFANGRELSCKAGSGKSICAFPDVCFTPPQTPATPPGVPIPYPNTGMSSDTSKGSRDVKITKKEVMLKNKSMFKKSVGDQAGCAPKKGVVTSQTGGKVYFNSWSMDVKIEGENAVRHLDLTTHNHGSVPGNTPTWPFIDSMAIDGDGKSDDPCQKDKKKEQDACKDFQPHKEDGEDACAAAGFVAPETGSAFTRDKHKNMSKSQKRVANECLTARACKLVPKDAPSGKKPGCCPGQTPHHLVEASAFFKTGRGTSKSSKTSRLTIASGGADGKTGYDEGDAPCVCAFGPNQYQGAHGVLHTFQGAANKADSKTGEPVTFGNGASTTTPSVSYAEARKNGAEALNKTFPKAKCDKKCTEAQLDAYHKNEVGVGDNDRLKLVDTGYTKDVDIANAEKLVDAGFDVSKAGLSPGTTGFSKLATGE